MNSTKNGNLLKPVAFFVIIVILLLTVVIVASGWQADTNEPDSGNADDGADVPTSGEADDDKTPDNQNPSEPEDAPTEQEPEPVPQPPSNLSGITGLEANANEINKAPLCFIVDTTAPNYGTSYAPLIIEVPIEDGKTRSILFTYDAESLGKIGSISHTRSYLSMLAKDFGAITVSLGIDSRLASELSDNSISLTENSGYHYTEYSAFSYSNGDLIRAMLKNLGIDTASNVKSNPFKFIGYFDEEQVHDNKAEHISICYSTSNKTAFAYSKDDGVYTLSKNGAEYRDLLNDRPSTFKNLFILFANSTTYETSEYVETSIDVLGGGSGLYFTSGSVIEITWSRDEAGVLSFLMQDGSPLLINRGRSYISFVKASETDAVEFS